MGDNSNMPTPGNQNEELIIKSITMKRTTVTLSTIAIALLTVTVISCKDGKKETNDKEGAHMEMGTEEGHHHESSAGEMDHGTMDHDMGSSDAQGTSVIDSYLQLKDALVADNKDEAAKSGQALASALGSFDISGYDEQQQKELSDIIEVAKEHGEHIAKSDIGHQREHFEGLGKDMVDFIAITGTSKTLYQQFCPMYNNNQGGTWLSASSEIQNPFFGSKMLTCGKVQKEIN